MKEEGIRTQEGIDAVCSGIHDFGTPESEMSGVTWMVVKGKGSNDDHPARIIGSERRSLVGGFSGLGEELGDLGEPGVVFGCGLGGHRCQTSQGGLAVS